MFRTFFGHERSEQDIVATEMRAITGCVCMSGVREACLQGSRWTRHILRGVSQPAPPYSCTKQETGFSVRRKQHVCLLRISQLLF